MRSWFFVWLLIFFTLTSPVRILAQSAPPQTTDDTSPSFLQGETDRKTMEAWFNSLSGDYHAGAEYWAAQRNIPNPGSCYGSQGTDLGQFTAGCLAAQQKLTPIDLRRKSDSEYRLGWNVTPPADNTTSPSSPPVSTPNYPPAPTTTNDFVPNDQGIEFLKNLIDADGQDAAAGEPALFQYQPLYAPTDSDDFRTTANAQIDAWMQNGTVPAFAADSSQVQRLFAFYWVGSELQPGSLCLKKPRSDDCYLQTLQKLGDVKANQDFVNNYEKSAEFLNLPSLQ